MHLLSLNQKGLGDLFVIVFPESIYVMPDVAATRLATCASPNHQNTAILDSHQPNAGQDAHDGEQLPEFDVTEQAPATDIYTVRTIHINTALH